MYMHILVCITTRARYTSAPVRSQVRKVLAGAPNADSIIEEVPYLMSPPALAQSLSNVSRW